jgi:tetratricopeptide (TPR) repeat protein
MAKDKDKSASEKDDKEAPKASARTPREGPKPVQIGGESMLDRLLPHIKKIIIGSILLAAAVMTFFQFQNCKQNNQERATEKLAQVFELANKPLAEPGQPSDPLKNPGFASRKERAEKLLDELTKRDADPGPAVRAGLLMDAGKIDEAITEYRSCQTGTTIDAVLCREGLGIALETKALAEKDPATKQKGLEDALDVFSRMQPAEDGPRYAYGQFHQARILLQMQKKAEGKALLEKVKAIAPEDLKGEVERRLLELGA